jgi:polyphosphate kinase
VEAAWREPAPARRRRYLNRELSHLDFSERILALAEDRHAPLLERVRFLAILSDNLDEFFQVRVAGLREQVIAGVTTTSPDGLTPAEQLRLIREKVESIAARESRVLAAELLPKLAEQGIAITGTDGMSRRDLKYLAAVFREQVLPVLTPLAVDPGHPFPYISHLSLNLAVTLRDPLRRKNLFARVKVPPLLPRLVPLEDGARLVPLEQVIAANLQALFPGMEIVRHHLFRVTRDADLDLVDGEAEDLLDAIQTELRRQRRQAHVVRLEIGPDMSADVLDLLMRELELTSSDIYRVTGLMDLGGLGGLYNLDRPDLKDEPWTPTTQARLRGVGAEPPDFFGVIDAGDVLVHHPYDSFATSIEAFIDQAAGDPGVLAIKQTLYRTSGPVSTIARSLARAAEAGKQVVALIELKARGDERANIAWAQALEEAGVHVVYGLLGLKTHAKVTLVVRQEEAGIRRYVHIGTGNYNAATASSYEDIGLLSADSDLGQDASDLFNMLTGYSRQRRYRRLLVAPTGLRNGIIRLIREEAAEPDGRIVIKVNNLVDPEVIDALYKASAAGAEIALIVRGICCLRPGVPGLSERITVRSLVGRFLEHSRVFAFGNERRGRTFYLGSSDLMPRNLDRRVEAVMPVADTALQARLAEFLDVCLADDVLAWELQPGGDWRKVATGKGVNEQRRMMELAVARSRVDAG